MTGMNFQTLPKLRERKNMDMAVCLNADSAYKDSTILAKDEFFVDKSGIIEKNQHRDFIS